MIALRYGRISIEDGTGLGLSDQNDGTLGLVNLRGWTDGGFFPDDGVSGRRGTFKPMLEACKQAAMIHGDTAVIVAARLDRFARSTVDTQDLLLHAEKYGYKLVALDLNIDTTTASGKLVVQVIAAVAEWERDMISERTRAALAQLKARGVKLGRPRLIDPAIETRIRDMRTLNMTLRQIALALTQMGVPTPSGSSKTWGASTVALVLGRA